MADVDVATQSAVYFDAPAEYLPNYIAVGPDGNIWMSDDSLRQIEVFIVDPIAVVPDGLTFPNVGGMQSVTVTEQGTSVWTASTNNPLVATVAQGQMSDQFVVTATGTGKCGIVVADSKGNKYTFPVVVQ